MQISRLFEMVYLLMEHGSMTATQLAERFEVSTRTIYRDVDLLSGAGIPIYSNKGRGGGIRLMPHFVLDRSLLSSEEQDEILFALQSLRAANVHDTQVLSRLSGLFQKSGADWLDVDFSTWNGGSGEQEAFALLKIGILERQELEFCYSNSMGETALRRVEPMKLYFKNSNWYLQAYCLNKKAFRTFKISRMQDVQLTDRLFDRREETLPDLTVPSCPPERMVSLILHFSPQMAFRIYDEFSAEQIQKNSDGSFTISAQYPEEPWLIGYLLSFGAFVEVLSPPEMREHIARDARHILSLYQK